jgi:hypothetical protein
MGASPLGAREVFSKGHAPEDRTGSDGEQPRQRPPFPLGKATSPWLEQSRARIAEQRFTMDLLRSAPDNGSRFTTEAVETIEAHWTAANKACGLARRRRGAAVERVVSHLDAVDADILQLAPASYVHGRLPGLLADIKCQLPANDARVKRIAELAKSQGNPLAESDRALIAATQRAASAEARRQIRRLSSFTRVLYATAAVLTIGAVLFAALGFIGRRNLPVCFNPVDGVVCPTSMTDTPRPKRLSASGQPKPVTPDVDTAMRDHAGRWDIALIEGVGLLAAAVAAAGSLSRTRGTATPFHVPLALAVLKLPTGALTAILGLLLMRGGFIPGLGALDTPAQVIAWAIILGYSQQLFTRFVDRYAEAQLDNFGRSDIVRRQDQLVAQGGLTIATSSST